jgi:hypothetical protein
LNDVFIELKLLPLLLLLIIAWRAGGLAARLMSSGSVERLRRKSLALLSRMVYMSLVGSVAMIVISTLTIAIEPGLWKPLLLLELLPVAVPLLVVWLVAYPRLQALCREASHYTGAPIDLALRKPATSAGLIVPFQLTGLGAMTSFYFILLPPAPFRLTALGIPAALVLAGAVLLWHKQARRASAVDLGHTAAVSRSGKKRLRGLGVLILALIAMSLPFTTVVGRSRMPETLETAGHKPAYGGMQHHP